MYNYATKKLQKNYSAYYTCATQNYRPYYTELRYTDNTTDKLSAHATDTNQVSCTQIRHSDVATYNLHMKLTWYILEMSIFAVVLGYSSNWGIVILLLR